MKSILEELACGNICPEPRYLKHNSEYEKAVEALCAAENKLCSALGEAGQELLRAYTEAQGAVNHLSNTDKFIYGYRLGALTMLEVLGGKEDLLVGEDK